MPLTTPDGIYYADSTAKMSAAAISAAEASSIQNALNTYRIEIDERSVAAVAPGIIVRWPKVTAPPDNWFLCDGSAVSRTVYVQLFAATGTFYGDGDGVNTFNLPNLTGDPDYDFIIKYRFSDGLRGVEGPIGPVGPEGPIANGTPQQGQASKTTSGTISIATQGVYQSTGLTLTLDTATDLDMVVGTDGFSLKNISGHERTLRFYASIDASVGSSNKTLGIKLAIDGAQIDATECRAATGQAGAEAKLVTSWIINVPDDSEVAVYVANHSGTESITLGRGRIVASAVTGYGAGVVPGGTTGQVLAKSTGDDYDTEWSSLTFDKIVADPIYLANKTLPAGYNGLTVGPVTVNDGVTITIPSDTVWVVL
jgi:hypothetical protein